MLIRFINNKKPIWSVLIDNRKNFEKYLLELDDLTLIEGIISCLEPFYKITKLISSST